MSGFFGWLPADAERPTAAVVAAMGHCLRTHPGERAALWNLSGLGVGLLAHPGREQGIEPLAHEARPAVIENRYHLWMSGEVFATPPSLSSEEGATLYVEAGRDHGFRRRLLRRLLEAGIQDVLPNLDGEYQIVLWDSAERRLTLLGDRFGSLPLYHGESGEGFAFAGGARGVLAAPGVRREPDREALREAVTFGGFRLGDRTNVEAVRMFPGACRAVAREGRLVARDRYWRWPSRQAAAPPAGTEAGRLSEELLREIGARWRTAVGRRLRGAERPGQTLSGGLDSRAILAEAAPRAPSWTAITYGVPGCDDARYAERAARAAGVHWIFQPLYSPPGARGDDGEAWLAERARHIQRTDGLVELVDLMHLESLPLQTEHLDVNLSGYIGDAVAGPTFAGVKTADDVLAHLPYYGGRLGLPWERALERAKGALADLDGADPRFALFAEKIPQSTNRLSAALRPYLKVRRPFTDYELFDFFQAIDPVWRREVSLYEHFLVAAYPSLFRHIPNQKTGLPVLSPPWRRQLARGLRFARRKALPWLARLGWALEPRRRLYSADEDHWRRPGTREAIRETVLRPGSIACDVFGRGEVEAVLTDWEERAAAPAQVIGALYVFETYHRDLAGFLRERRAGQGAPA